MNTYDFFEADGVDFICPVTLEAASGVTSLVGATVSVGALLNGVDTDVEGTATVASATSIRCTFDPWALASDIRPVIYQILVTAEPVGFPPQTVAAFKARVWKSAGTAPAP